MLDQAGVAVELRIHDNGSSDGSVAIAEAARAADRRVSFHRNPPHLTFPHSMNLGLEATAAEFFVAWACDDEMLPGNLVAKVAALRDSGAGLAIGGWEFDDAAGDRRRVTWPAMGAAPRTVPRPQLFPMIATANPIAMPSVVMRTDALRAAGGFDTRPELTCDWLLWLRLALRCDAVWLPQPLVLYRQHDDNGSSRAWREGTYARELLATVDEALADPLFPPAWAPRAPEIAAGVVEFLAAGLARHGHRTLANGPYPAHAAIGAALLRHPGDGRLRELWAGAVVAAGLAAPAPGCTAVLRPQAGDVECAVALAHRLHAAGMIGECVVPLAGERVESAAAAFEAALAGRDELDVTLVPGAEADRLLEPGRLFLGRFGAAEAVAAELGGVPALTFGMPTPFGELAA